MGHETIVRILTACALVGLLGAVGLRLTWNEVRNAVSKCRFTLVLLVNFLVVPALTTAAAVWLGLSRDTSVAMVLLAVAPFAPVVPIFARMARADLALAAGLTAIFPMVSVLLAPPAAEAALRLLARAESVRFDMLSSLGTLAATITLPLVAGVFVSHRTPRLGMWLLRPVEAASEATGAMSLAYVTVTEFGSIVNLGWRAWLAMGIVCEVSLLLGWTLGGPARGARQVVALGTANRNIALALLVAVQSFPGTPVVSAVVGNGILLIALGLVHVAWWRFARVEPAAA